MGEIAEAMINGELCEACGAGLEQKGDGYPMYCSLGCAADRGADESQVVGEI